MIGVLLINLGSPSSPKTKDVRRYLREFLSDPRVIDIPFLLRWPLVNLIIAPFRAPKSAENYQKIWDGRGSPFLYQNQDLCRAVQKELGENFSVEIGMRYGKPSIYSALIKLKERNCEKIRILPLYPQYASSTTGSTEELVLRLDREMEELPDLQFLPPFFEHPGFLKSFAEVGNFFLEEFKPNHILFSFHGLPERHILKEDISKNHCLKSIDCCEKIIPANAHCYRAHCFQTAYGIARELNLKKGDYSISFQSRLGRTRWIHPFTDFVLREWAKTDKKRIAVFCPSFVTDCLETLEEIGIRAREDFIQHGGEDLLLIPSLNTHPTWVKAISTMIRGT